MELGEIIKAAGYDLVGDLVGYETLIRFMLEHHIWEVEGDFVEIGAFLGGGTNKLARLAKVLEKNVHVVDIFDITWDQNKTDNDILLSEIYASTINRLDISLTQREIFDEINRANDNLCVHEVDAKEVTFEENFKVSFAFIDGEHSYDAVKRDFKTVWKHVSSNGIVAFHDYNGDITPVTRGINELIESYGDEIKKTAVKESKRLIFIQKK